MLVSNDPIICHVLGPRYFRIHLQLWSWRRIYIYQERRHWLALHIISGMLRALSSTCFLEVNIRVMWGWDFSGIVNLENPLSTLLVLIWVMLCIEYWLMWLTFYEKKQNHSSRGIFEFWKKMYNFVNHLQDSAKSVWFYIGNHKNIQASLFQLNLYLTSSCNVLLFGIGIWRAEYSRFRSAITVASFQTLHPIVFSFLCSTLENSGRID